MADVLYPSFKELLLGGDIESNWNASGVFSL